MEDLKDIKVLIIDPSGYSKNLLRQILLQIGVQNIEPVANTTEALDKMRLQLFDVVFCDENCAPLGPTAFIKALRFDLQTQNVTLPVILVSSGANFGLRRTVPHALGVGIGFTLMIVLVGVGLMELFDLFPVLNLILKVVSVVYLLWLAWKIASAPAFFTVS